MQNSQFQNFAFISYRHTNTRWARWLQRKLEAYRLPATMKKAVSDQTRIRPVFRDRTDLSSGLIKEELRKELERSRFLIVLCSRELSKKSDYVDFEIECFLEMGRMKNIIPFIIDGTPHAQHPEDECFPKALLALEDTPLGIDMKKDLPRKALIRLIAYLLNVRFDTLWQRDLRKQRSKGLVAAVAAIALLISGLWAYDFYIPKKRYYTDYVLRYSIPVGIEELTAAQTHNIGSFYTIISCRNKVCELRHENSYGVIKSSSPEYDAERPAWVKYDTYSSDKLRVARYLNEYGVPVMTLKYSDLFGKDGRTQTVDFYQGLNDSVAQNLLGNLTGAYTSVLDSMALGANRSRIIRNIITYTDDGYEARIMFASDTRSLTSYAADANGIYGREYEVNALGQRTRIYYLNAKGERTTLPNGVHSLAIEYYGGQYKSIDCFDALDQPIIGEEGYAHMELEYDSNPNNFRVSYYDTEGKLVLNKDGYARAEASFQNGLMVRFSILDTSLKPCYMDGFSTQEIEYQNGRHTRVVCLDTAGKRTVSKDGSADTRYQYNEKGRIVRLESLNAEGNLCYNAYGFAIEISEYDEQGNLTLVRHLGPDGKPCYANMGDCLTEYEYQDNRLIATHYLDTNGKPAINPFYGYASLLIEYSDDNASRYTTLNEEGSLCCNKDGYAGVRCEYEDGNLTYIEYLGADSLPCLYQGISSKQMQYENGKLVSEKYYGVNGQPIMCDKGFMEIRNEYDNLGRLTQQSYYNEEGHPSSCRNGYASIRYAYDENGRKTQEAYFNVNLQPTTDNDGVHGYSYTYDQSGNVLTIRNLDKFGGLFILRGYTTEKRAYDERGNLTEQSLFTETPLGIWPVITDQGWSVKKMAYNNCNQRISESYFDKNGAACLDEYSTHQYLYEYDSKGNRTFIRYKDSDGQPLSPNEAYQVEYDEKGQMTCERWFTGDVTVANRKTYEYNARGNCIKTRFWEGEDTPMLYEGYHELRQTYNDFGFLIKTEYLGIDEQPIDIPDGYATIISGYDDYGRPVSETYMNAKGAPCKRSSEFARIEWSYNPHGFWSEERYFDEKGAACSPVAYMQWKYDDTYYISEIAYFGPDGQRVTNPESGYAIVRYDWKDNLKTSEAYFDPYENPVEVDGIARLTWEYDEADSIIENNSYRSDGSLILEKQMGSRQAEIGLVTPDMPGAQLGLKSGDILLMLGDWQYDNTANSEDAIEDLRAYFDNIRGKTVLATFLRTLDNGSEQVFSVQFTYGTMGVTIVDRLITDKANEHLLQVMSNSVPKSQDVLNQSGD